MEETKEEKKENKKEMKLSEKLQKELDQVKEELNKAKSDVDQWKNSYYKAYADTENLRKSIEKDHREALKYRIEGFVGDLLNVLDGFHLAINNEVKSDELKNYLVGFTYIYNNLLKVLEEEGVKEINPKVGDDFSEKCMQAVETVESDDTPNKVIKVNLRGYWLKDHLVRPAMVVVSIPKKKEETPKENEDNQGKDA